MRSKFAIFAAAVAALSGLLFGYDTGVISGALPLIKNQFHLSPALEGAVVSAVLFGATFSSLASGRLTDKFGRKKVILGTSVLFAAGSALTALAPTVLLLIAGRVLLGIAIGIASFAAPLYISELSHPKLRGALVSLNQLAITVGIVVSYLVDYQFTQAGNWHAMVALGCLPAVLLGAGILLLPESARWLLLRDREKEATGVLKKLRGTHDVEGEIEEIKTSIGRKTGGWRALFTGKLRSALIVGVGLGIFQQFVGINTVIYYAPKIYAAAGMQSGTVAILATAGVGLVNVFMTVVSIFLIDRLGRRPLLVVGNIGMALSLGALALTSLLSVTGKTLEIVGVLSTLAFVGFFAISLGPVFWLVISEIYPLPLRGVGMSFATAISWLSNMCVSFSFPLLLADFGIGSTFAMFSGLCIASLLFTMFFVPETKGLSLEEIERGEGSSPFRRGLR
ncbi:MAG TPA: sugar porter family MFS transporter [Chroococcales cyanobacterium]